jgi:uncharacterized Ntn-hydrolase superfamily protein
LFNDGAAAQLIEAPAAEARHVSQLRELIRSRGIVEVGHVSFQRRQPGRSRGARPLLALGNVILLSVLASPLNATWSLIAIDRVTGQIGVAGASCTRNVQGIGAVVPGKGAIIVQAMSSNAARDHGLDLLRKGATAPQIITALRDARFDPENQQYAVLLAASDHPPAAYTGNLVAGWHGVLIGDGVAVQGNILAGERVVTAALAAFRGAEGKTLTERLLAGLVAGAEAGGDRRCGAQHATSAFVTVYNPDDPEPTPHVHVGVYGIEPGGEPAVGRLAQEVEAVLQQAETARSRRVYVIPAPSR